MTATAMSSTALIEALLALGVVDFEPVLTLVRASIDYEQGAPPADLLAASELLRVALDIPAYAMTHRRHASDAAIDLPAFPAYTPAKKSKP